MITIEIDFNEQHVNDLLCSALEGGSSYWARVVERIKPPEGARCKYLQEWPLAGGCLVIAPDDDPSNAQRLDREAVERGLKTMLREYPRHFARFLDGGYDAETADVFLQCCLFGEIVYG